MLGALGHPEDEFASVLIAGTNGKGSVAAMTESVLREAGYRTGLYTSPHLVSARERFRVDGKMIPAGRLNSLTRRVLSSARRCRTSLTEFETQTLAAFLHFAGSKVDIAVVEVGLGGRLDATNALPAPEATAITSIGRDHQEWLGDTLDQIYFEKGGVVRPDSPHVEAVPEGLKPTPFHARNPAVQRLGREIRVAAGKTDWARSLQSLTVTVSGRRYGGLRIGLLGAHQSRNAALAVALLDNLRRRGWRVPEAAVRRGLARARWPGRWQVFGGRPAVLLDGAHNPEGAASLAAAYAESPWKDSGATVIFGCLKDKNAEELVRTLSPLAHRVFTVGLPTARSRDPRELRDMWARRAPAAACADFSEAWELARQDDLPVVVTGSLYLVGEALKEFGKAA